MNAMNEHDYLYVAHSYALRESGCKKVQVGSVICNNVGEVISFGANRTYPVKCTEVGCLREQLYGDNSKVHRNPGDCRAIHSEVDAIARASAPIYGGTIYVTRYPCEACARAIVSAGIKTVYYGRQQEISEETKRIFESADIEVIHISDWIRADTIK